MREKNLPSATPDDAPIWGAEAIGAEIGLTARQAYYLLDAGHLPGRKIGNRWVSSRAQLRRVIFGEAQP